MKTILEIHDLGKLTSDNDELLTLAIEEVVKCITGRDFLGAGEWYASMLPFYDSKEAEETAYKIISLWASTHDGIAAPAKGSDLIGRVHEYVGEDLAIAVVTTCARLKASGKPYPAEITDLVFKLATPIQKTYHLEPLRPQNLLTASVAKYRSIHDDVSSVVGNFLRTDCLGAKAACLEVLRRLRPVKSCFLPTERPILGELDILFGPTFRSFCEACERRDPASTAKLAPALREQATKMRTNVGHKQNSTLWCTIVEPVIKHVIDLVDQESKWSEDATTPQLSLAISEFKLDLSKINREMTFSCKLLNRGQGLARSVQCEATVNKNIEVKLVAPDPGFEVGGNSEQIVTFAITLLSSCSELSLPVRWKCLTLRDKRYESTDNIRIQQQHTQPDWEKLRMDPPYGTKAVTKRDRLFGRDAFLKRMMIYAAGGTSTFVWGAKRVGKTSVVQVLADEMRKLDSFAPIYLRIGEIGSLHEGQIAFTIATRLSERLGPVIATPPESDFGATLSKLIPWSERLIEACPNKKLIVIIDEFDDLDSSFYTGERGKRFVKALRSLSEVGLTFFFVGSERMHTIYSKHASDLNKWTDVFLDTIESREDCKILITKPVEGAIEYQPECVDRIVDYCGGNPFYMHLVCSEVFSRCATEERTFVGESDLHWVLESRCNSLGETNFAHFWEDNPELDEALKFEQASENCLLLTCLAVGGSSIDSIYEAQDRLGLTISERISEADVSAIVDRLRKRAVIRKTSMTEYSIRLPVFKDWLSQNAELRLLPRWRKYCAARNAEKQTQNDSWSSPLVLESAFPISEDDLLQVSQNLVYCGKQKDVVEIRTWLRQFDDDVRIEIAYRLLKRLAEQGFVNEGLRRHQITTLENALHAARKEIGRGTWTVVTGRHANLCVSYVDSDMKSGATTAREFAKSLRPGKQGSDRIYDWMRNQIDNDPVVLLLDDFTGSGTTLCGGLKRFLENAEQSKLIERYLKEGRILSYVLSAFPEGKEKVMKTFPQVRFLTAHIFGEEVRALDPQAGIFENQNEIDFAKSMLLQLGQELCPQNPLGFKNFAALVCFHNTVPNNTLPIFWSNGNVNEKPWKPLFPRA